MDDSSDGEVNVLNGNVKMPKATNVKASKGTSKSRSTVPVSSPIAPKSAPFYSRPDFVRPPSTESDLSYAKAQREQLETLDKTQALTMQQVSRTLAVLARTDLSEKERSVSARIFADLSISLVQLNLLFEKAGGLRALHKLKRGDSSLSSPSPPLQFPSNSPLTSFSTLPTRISKETLYPTLGLFNGNGNTCAFGSVFQILRPFVSLHLDVFKQAYYSTKQLIQGMVDSVENKNDLDRFAILALLMHVLNIHPLKELETLPLQDRLWKTYPDGILDAKKDKRDLNYRPPQNDCRGILLAWLESVIDPIISTVPSSDEMLYTQDSIKCLRCNATRLTRLDLQGRSLEIEVDNSLVGRENRRFQVQLESFFANHIFNAGALGTQLLPENNLHCIDCSVLPITDEERRLYNKNVRENHDRGRKVTKSLSIGDKTSVGSIVDGVTLNHMYNIAEVKELGEEAKLARFTRSTSKHSLATRQTQLQPPSIIFVSLKTVKLSANQMGVNTVNDVIKHETFFEDNEGQSSLTVSLLFNSKPVIYRVENILVFGGGDNSGHCTVQSIERSVDGNVTFLDINFDTITLIPALSTSPHLVTLRRVDEQIDVTMSSSSATNVTIEDSNNSSASTLQFGTIGSGSTAIIGPTSSTLPSVDSNMSSDIITDATSLQTVAYMLEKEKEQFQGQGQGHLQSTSTPLAPTSSFSMLVEEQVGPVTSQGATITPSPHRVQLGATLSPSPYRVQPLVPISTLNLKNQSPRVTSSSLFPAQRTTSSVLPMSSTLQQQKSVNIFPGTIDGTTYESGQDSSTSFTPFLKKEATIPLGGALGRLLSGSVFNTTLGHNPFKRASGNEAIQRRASEIEKQILSDDLPRTKVLSKEPPGPSSTPSGSAQTPPGAVPSGARPSGARRPGARPPGAGTPPSGPSSAGPSSAGPSPSGTPPSGPSSAGPSSAGPPSAGPPSPRAPPPGPPAQAPAPAPAPDSDSDSDTDTSSVSTPRKYSNYPSAAYSYRDRRQQAKRNRTIEKKENEYSWNQLKVLCGQSRGVPQGEFADHPAYLMAVAKMSYQGAHLFSPPWSAGKGWNLLSGVAIALGFKESRDQFLGGISLEIAHRAISSKSPLERDSCLEFTTPGCKETRKLLEKYNIRRDHPGTYLMPDDATETSTKIVEGYISLALSRSRCVNGRCSLQFLRPDDVDLVIKAKVNLQQQDVRGHTDLPVFALFVSSRNRYNTLFCRRGNTEAREKQARKEKRGTQLQGTQQQQQFFVPVLGHGQVAPIPAPVVPQGVDAPLPPPPPPPPAGVPLPLFLQPPILNARYTERSWIDILEQRGFSQNAAALAIVDLKLLLTQLGQNAFVAGSSVLAITELTRRRNFNDIDLYGFLGEGDIGAHRRQLRTFVSNLPHLLRDADGEMIKMDTHSFTVFPSPLLGGGNSGSMLSFTLKYPGGSELQIQLILAFAGRSPATITRSFWGSHMAAWYTLGANNTLMCYSCPEAEATRKTRQVTQPPAAILSHVVETFNKTKLALVSSKHVAEMIIASLKLLASTASPAETAVSYRIPVDKLSALRDKYSAAGTQERTKQNDNAKSVLFEFLRGRIDGISVSFSENVYNSLSSSLRRQSQRVFRDITEGGLSYNWLQSVKDLIVFLRSALPGRRILSSSITFLQLANSLEIASGLSQPQLQPVPLPAPPISTASSAAVAGNGVDIPAAADARAGKAVEEESRPSRPVRFGNKKNVKGPPSSNKKEKVSPVAFSRYMRLAGHLVGSGPEWAKTTNAPDPVKDAIRGILEEHVVSASKAVHVAGMRVIYNMLHWWKNKGTERAPLISKRNHGPSTQTYRDALVQGRSGKKIPQKFSSGGNIGSVQVSIPARVPGDNVATTAEANHMGAMGALMLGWDKTHGIEPKLNPFLKSSFYHALDTLLKGPVDTTISQADIEQLKSLHEEKREKVRGRKKQIFSFLRDAVLRLNKRKLVRKGGNVDFDNLLPGDVSIDTKYNPTGELIKAMGVSKLPTCIENLINKVSGWLWNEMDVEDELTEERKEKLARSALKKTVRLLKKAAAEAMEEGIIPPKAKSKSAKVPKKQKLQKSPDNTSNIPGLDIAGFVKILTRKNNAVRMGANLLLHMLEEIEGWLEPLSPESKRHYLGTSFKAMVSLLTADGRTDPNTLVEESIDNSGKVTQKEEVYFDINNDLEDEEENDKNDGEDKDEDDDDERDNIYAPGVPLPSKPGTRYKVFRGKKYYNKVFKFLPLYKMKRRFQHLDGEGVKDIINGAYKSNKVKYACLAPLVEYINSGISVAEILDAVFLRPADRNGALAATILTDGFTLVVPYTRDNNLYQRLERPRAPLTRYASGPGKGYAPSGKRRITIAKRRALKPLDTSSVPLDVSTGKKPFAPVQTPYARVIGVDPGQANPASCSEKLKNGEWVQHKLSSRHYSDLTSKIQRVRESRKHCQGLKEAFEILGHPDISPMTSKPEQFLRYVEAVESVKADIFAETLKPRWADAAFLARQRRTRALDSFWSGIVAGYAEHGTSGVTPIFAYGNADVSGRATPSTGLVKSLQRIVGIPNVVFVDEFRSTMTHNACGCLLHKVWTYNKSHKQVTRDKRRAAFLKARGEMEDPKRKVADKWLVRGLLICRNPLCPNKHASFVDRDGNPCETFVENLHARDEGRPIPLNNTRGYTFSKEERKWVNRNYFVLPRADPATFKVPHGDGGTDIHERRQQEKEKDYSLSGMTAPLAGPSENRRPLLPTVSLGREHSRSANWPLDQEKQARVPANIQQRDSRVAGESSRIKPLTTAPSSLLSKKS
jgi:hypothetical protein